MHMTTSKYAKVVGGFVDVTIEIDVKLIFLTQ